jgi:hypothetical protein
MLQKVQQTPHTLPTVEPTISPPIYDLPNFFPGAEQLPRHATIVCIFLSSKIVIVKQKSTTKRISGSQTFHRGLPQ